MLQNYSKFCSWHEGNYTQLPARRYDDIDFNKTSWSNELKNRVFGIFDTHNVRFELQESGEVNLPL